MDQEDSSARDVKLSRLQFIYISVINFPTPIPGEHEEFSTNLSRALW